MYDLSTPECSWSLRPFGSKEGAVCCLKHNPDVRVTEDWMSSEKYDPSSSGGSPYDINLDNAGNIVLPKEKQVRQ